MFGSIRKVAKRAVLSSLNAWELRGARAQPQPPGLWDLSVTTSGALAWDGVDLSSLAASHGTPLHVISQTRLEKDYAAFRSAFASQYPRLDIAYSYKTNPLPAVISALHGLGATAEVISEFELWLALKLGVPRERIIFNGPAKTRSALELAMQQGVKLINIDNFVELELLEEIATRSQRRQRVGIRVVTSVGWSGQFGMSIADGSAMAAFRRLKASPRLFPCGVHIHLGNGLRNTGIYAAATRDVVTFIQSLRRELAIEVEHVDLGGGFGVPTVRPLGALDEKYALNGFPLRVPQPGESPAPTEFAREITTILKSGLGGSDGTLPELILEPGRAITSSAQLLLLNVIAIKPGDHTGIHAILDGGKNIAMPPAWEYHEAFLVNSATDRPKRVYSIFGPLCHTGDVMFRSRSFPELRVGDLLAVMDAGAYFIPNQMNFSNPRPSVVMVRDGDTQLIRERESFDDIVRLDALGAQASGVRRAASLVE